jgi:hypothetical protein
MAPDAARIDGPGAHPIRFSVTPAGYASGVSEKSTFIIPR